MKSSQFVKSVLGQAAPVLSSKEVYLKRDESLKFKVARIMLCGIFKQQYYRNTEDAIKESLDVFEAIAKQDPMYLLKAAVYARKLNLKGNVKLAVAILASKASDAFLNQNRDAFVTLLSTFHPGQLLQFVELQKSKAFGKGFGARSQKWCQRVMESWDAEKVETYTLKYPAAFKALLRLVHPNYRDARGVLTTYLLDKSNKFPHHGKENAHGKRQQAVEMLKAAVSRVTTISADGSSWKADLLKIAGSRNMSHSKIAEVIIENNIPWDVVKGFYSDYLKGDVGMATLTQMGLSALLLNTRSMIQSGLLNDNNAFQAFCMKLNEVKKGRALPIDFAKPYLHVEDKRVKNELVKALVASLDADMPEVQNCKVAVSIDISGSMSGDRLQTAGMLAMPFLKARDLWFTTFDTEVYEEGDKSRHHYYFNSKGMVCPVLSGQEPEAQVHALLNLKTNGGTNIAAPIEKAISKNKKVDLFVLITDEAQNCGRTLMSVWNQYKENINSRAELWVCNAANYNFHSADINDPSVTVYQTLTPAIFKNLQFVGQDLVSSIEEFVI